MTIKEVERRTGLPRSVVRFYEKEGLIAPRRGGVPLAAFLPGAALLPARNR